jgi:flagellar biosynthesis/type III secretory pathway protein FliH
MNFAGLKNYLYALSVAVMMVAASGLFGTVQAQSRDWDRWEERREQREDWRDRQRRDRYDDRGRYDDDRYGRSDRYNREVEKGFRDGLDRGEKDARTNRVPDPNNSSHYRKGTDAYREGFRRGYNRGYRQHYRYGRWW